MVRQKDTSSEGTHWVTSKHPTENRRKPYFTDNKELGKEFRKSIHQRTSPVDHQGQVTVWKVSLNLYFKKTDVKPGSRNSRPPNWNVFVEGPPHGRSKPEHVLKYLARYISGGPIADSRLIRWTEPEGRVSGDVWFWARTRDKENKPEPFRLSGVEFVRRWSMHILPKGYTRSRSYGGFHGPQRRSYLELCRQVLGITESAAEQASDPVELLEWKLPTCERCQAGDGIDLVIGASKLERCLQVRRLSASHSFTFRSCTLRSGCRRAHSIGGYG